MVCKALSVLESLIKKLPWVRGRHQDGYYFKIKLFESKCLKSDLYLLYYPEGSHIPVHRDEVPGCRHHRMNVELVRPEVGGWLKYGSWNAKKQRFHYFMSDEFHEVTKVEKGYRLVFSLGWLT